MFSIKCHEQFFNSGPFDVDKYINEIKSIQNLIPTLKQVEKNQVTDDQWDRETPREIDLKNTKNWIQSKFELVMHIKKVSKVIEGEEYKLFEQLMTPSDSLLHLPIPLGFENDLITQTDKSQRMIPKEDFMTVETQNRINDRVEKHRNEKHGNFHFPPKEIKRMTLLLEPDLASRPKLDREVAYKEIETILYSMFE